MCRIFKIIYACGHRDVIKAPCEWREEGRINILGRRVPCENSTRNLADLSRHCMACSPDPAGPDLINLSSRGVEYDVESYISFDEKDVMATIIRNESHIRKRAKMSRVTLTPARSSGFPTMSELNYQYHVNEEFLARRLKRRCFQQHLEHRGEYQDFLEAAQDHLDARMALNTSVFSIQESPQATTSTGNWQGAAFQTVRITTVHSSTQIDDIEVAAVRPSHPSPPSSLESDDSSGTITASRPRTHRGAFSAISPESDDSSTTTRPSHPRTPRPPSPTVSSESDSSGGLVTGSRPRIINSYRWVRRPRDDPQSLMDLDIDGEEQGFIESREEGGDSSKLIELDDGEAQEQGNQGEDQYAEWSGFVGGLSDEWAEAGMSRPEIPKVMVPLDSEEGIARLADIRSFLGMRPDTKPLDIWNFAINNNDLMANITGSTLPVRHRHLGQARRPGFDRDPGLETVSDFADEKEERSYLLEGRRARIPYEVDFGGRLRAPRHQARNASRLRMSWTYADSENSVSPPDSQDEPISSLSLLPTSQTLQDEPVSPLSSSPTSPDVPVSPLFSSLSPLSSFYNSARPHLSLKCSSPNFKEPVSPPDSDDGSSSGSVSPRPFECKYSPTLIQHDSTTGQRMLSDLRNILAIPDSKTPQDIFLFINLHPELMRALRTGHVPVKKVPQPVSTHERRQQKARASYDPLPNLQATSDREQRLMRKNLALALKILDWDEIDSEPIPLTPSSPWDEGFVSATEGDEVDDDDEEECDNWVRTTVSPKPNRLTKIDKKYLIKHQVKKPSPLRVTLTRRESDEGCSSTHIDQEKGITATQRGQDEEFTPTQSGSGEEIATALCEPEIWEDVDLNVSSSLQERMTDDDFCS